MAAGAVSIAGLAVGLRPTAVATGDRGAAGYIEGPTDLDSLGRAAPWLGAAPLQVIPASSTVADGSLADTSVPMRVLGLYPSLPASGYQSAFLDVLFNMKGKTTSFGAWSYDAKRSCASSNLCFGLPVSATEAPEFRLTTVDSTGAKRTSRTILRVTTRASDQKLRRGYYLLGLTPGLWSTSVDIDPSAPEASHLSLVVSVGV